MFFKLYNKAISLYPKAKTEFVYNFVYSCGSDYAINYLNLSADVVLYQLDKDTILATHYCLLRLEAQ